MDRVDESEALDRRVKALASESEALRMELDLLDSKIINTSMRFNIDMKKLDRLWVRSLERALRATSDSK